MIFNAEYTGSLKCAVTHPDGEILTTATPVASGGDGSTFSPTDLVAAGLVTCILTTIGMWGDRHGYDFRGVRATVEKEMAVGPPRRIGRLAVTVTLPALVTAEMRPRVERVAHLCPVHSSLHPDIDAPMAFVYKEGAGVGMKDEE